MPGEPAGTAPHAPTASVPFPPDPDSSRIDLAPSSFSGTRIRRVAEEAERRQLTVLFCDLADSTVLAGQLDPEDLREVVRAYQEAAGGAIQRFEGHVAQYLGDGILAYFGYPRAHEDDAQRSVHAALGILEAVGQLNFRLHRELGLRLAVRIGVHTGLVVVGDVGGAGRTEQLAIGETPNVAARVQGLAAPGAIVVSQTTHHLVRGFFTCDDMGERTLKGVERPMRVHRVLRATGAVGRLEAAGARELTALVGRDRELGRLNEGWLRARGGAGQAAMIHGDAGLGKSRLVAALRDIVRREGGSVLVFKCSPYHTLSSLHPVIDCLGRLLELDAEDSPESRLARLEWVVEDYGLPIAEAVPAFAALLSMPTLDRYPPSALSPQQQKRRTLDFLLAWLAKEAERAPTLTVWEDLHWADPSTLELVGLLLDRVPALRLLAAATYRSEFRPPWPAPRGGFEVAVQRLDPLETGAMVGHVLGGKRLPPEVLSQVLARSDGVPLYIEEIIKYLIEAGLLRAVGDRYELTGPLPPSAIPATLQDSLMARLDRLSTPRDIAQLGATIGREFSYALMRAVSPWEEDALQEGLQQLVTAELLYESGEGERKGYTFKHALVQEAASQSLLKARRQQFHQLIATALDEKFPETAAAQPELLAHHLTGAGLARQAIPHWLRAGERAITGCAFVEAIGHLTRGVELLRALPESPERMREEVHFLELLAVPLAATKGYSSPETDATYESAYQLCARLGDDTRLFTALYGLARSHMLRGEYASARSKAERLLGLAERAEEPAMACQANRALGATCFYMGDFVRARRHLEGVLAVEVTRDRREKALLSDVVDCWIAARSYLGWLLWVLGRPDQSRRITDESIAAARELNHPFSLTLALSFGSWVHQFCGDLERTRTLVDEILALSAEHSFGFWTGWGTVMKGWTELASGDAGSAVATMRAGLAQWRARGSRLGLSYFLCLSAEAHAAAGAREEGLAALAEASRFAEDTGERFWLPELHRVRGSLHQAGAAPDLGQAEASFQAALALAGSQGARALQLRAAISLHLLAESQGRAAQTLPLLAEACTGLEAGKGTADRRAAERLLGVRAP